MRVVFLILVLLGICTCFYDERLVVRPLPQQHLLTSFKFKLQSEDYDGSSTHNNNITHYNLFPRTLPPVMQASNLKELHLRFSQGWYDSEVWGKLPYEGFKSGGTGVELWAVISSDTKENLWKHWLKLANSLSALFCASLNFIDSSTTTFPKNAFQSSNNLFVSPNEELYLLRSSLPREPVCTENLTPFLKLIPTKGKSGVSSLLDGHKVFNAEWNSMSIDVITVYNDDGSYYYDMDINIDLIMNVPKKLEINKSLIIKPIPGDELICDPTKRHDIYHCFPLINKSGIEINLKTLFGKDIASSVPFSDNTSMVCTITDDENWNITALINVDSDHLGEVGHYIYSKENNETCFYLDEEKPYNFILKANDTSKVLPVEQPPIMASRSLGSNGLRIVFQNFGEEEVEVVYFESLPWFLRIYLSTLKVTGTNLTDFYYSPSKDRLKPSHLELTFTIPANSTVTMNYDFDKSLLLIAEYPPDANHGFDIEPAVITTKQNSKETYQFRTTSLLVTLPTPDFSMPYNVIILTGTVITLIFGAIFQLLLRRVVTVEEYELLNNQPKLITKLKLKLQLITGKLKQVKTPKEKMN